MGYPSAEGQVNAKIARTGVTALHVAAMHGHLYIAKLLVSGGADTSLVDVLGNGAIDFAPGRSAVQEYLMKLGMKPRQKVHEPIPSPPIPSALAI